LAKLFLIGFFLGEIPVFRGKVVVQTLNQTARVKIPLQTMLRLSYRIVLQKTMYRLWYMQTECVYRPTFPIPCLDQIWNDCNNININIPFKIPTSPGACSMQFVIISFILFAQVAYLMFGIP